MGNFGNAMGNFLSRCICAMGKKERPPFIRVFLSFPVHFRNDHPTHGGKMKPEDMVIDEDGRRFTRSKFGELVPVRGVQRNGRSTPVQRVAIAWDEKNEAVYRLGAARRAPR